MKKHEIRFQKKLELGLKFLIVYLVHTAHLTNTKKRYELKTLDTVRRASPIVS